MFTGLIEEVGVVSRRSGPDIAVLAKTVLEDLAPGDSIAVSGVCLTVVALNRDDFVVQASPETLARTTLAQLRPGDAVNLERAMAANKRFGGHFVLGHVDGIGRVADIRDQGAFSLWRFQAPGEAVRYLAPKGSVAIDGVSLTVVEPAADTFAVAIIPATRKNTTLTNKRPGDAVNIEADIIGKHVYHCLKSSEPGGVTPGLLERQGFL